MIQDKPKIYILLSEVQVYDEYKIGYIYLQPRGEAGKKHHCTIPLVVDKECDIRAGYKAQQWLINLDVDAEGRIIGIELLDSKLAPPERKENDS